MLSSPDPFKVDKSIPFECVIAPPHALAAAILQSSRKGLYMDSSWRNKNAFRCPLTMLITINDYNRMTPGKFSETADAKRTLLPPCSRCHGV